VTIHSEHPFLEPESERDPARRLRGRLGGAVTLWTSGAEGGWAGLTVSSLMVAAGDPGRVLSLVDPDADLYDRLRGTGRAVVHLLGWEQRALADAFAGTAPSPGGPFRMGEFAQSAWGPRLTGATTWAAVSLEDEVEVGWSVLVTCVLDEVTIGEDEAPLVHRRGRYLRPSGESVP
jgi:flavin reductase (DIM6/NTAB) family NADH-FMN oxidoreductase RutF